MPARINLCGRRFGRLIVVSESHKDKNRHYHWICLCDCGTHKTINGEILKRGESLSCGCYHKEMMTELGKKTIHGQSRTRLYKIYKGIRDRCLNKSSLLYERYGAKGISLCDEWMDFDAFYEWSRINGYADNLTIDRIDNDKGYHPDNCRWTTHSIQGQNRKTCLTVDQVKEIKKLLSCGVTYKEIAKRFNRAVETIGRINRKIHWSNVE